MLIKTLVWMTLINLIVTSQGDLAQIQVNQHLTQAERKAQNYCNNVQDLFVVSKFYLDETNWINDVDPVFLRKAVRVVYGVFEDKEGKFNYTKSKTKSFAHKILVKILNDFHMYGTKE